MPKIEEAPNTETPKAKPAGRKAKTKATKERPVVHPEIVVSVCRGDTAINSAKAKELLGWTDENVTGDDYHLVDGKEVKVRLENSTHNRPFYRTLADKYVQELLNKRWRVNGETVVIGTRGEVLSGQHRLASVVLADQERERNPHWEENWPTEVTMDTVVVLGVDESDEVVNTLDTGKPRSMADTLYRSEHFADLPPKQRKTASKVGGFAIKMLWSRTGASRDPFSAIGTHGAFLQFLDDHLTLRKCVRHVIEEDAAGAVSAVLSPGYASAMMYLMAVSKSDPVQYLVKAKEGVRSEKYLDKTMLERASDFWMWVGKVETPDLRAVRDRLKSYAKRVDEDGLSIAVSLEEKMAILTLAWITYAEGRNPTLAEVTPKYHPAKDDHTQPLMKDPPRLGGIDIADDEEEEEEDDADPVEDLKADLEASRPDRIKERYEQRKKEAREEKEAKKAQMADAVPPSNGKPKSPTEEVREQYAAIAKDHPGKVIFVRSRTSGAMTTIEDDAKKVAKVLKEKVTNDGNGLTRITFSKDEADVKLTKLVKAKVKVAVAEEVPTGKPGEKAVKVTDYVPE